MRIVNTETIYDTIKEMAKTAVTHVDSIACQLIKAASANEKNTTAKFALDTIIENNIIAASENVPSCQDTGMAVVFIDVGQAVFLEGPLLEDIVNKAIKDAYEENFFRKSVLHPLSRQNTKTNTPAVIHTSVVPGEKVTVSFLAKGFGSENMSRLYMLTPSQGIEGIIGSVVETVKAAGANPCPPIFVGIGIGGTMEKACILSKRALLRKAGQPSSDLDTAKLEQQILNEINELNIGPQGFGGNNTALAVAIETYPTHIAGLPVAINIQCHAVRHLTKVL